MAIIPVLFLLTFAHLIGLSVPSPKSQVISGNGDEGSAHDRN
jgi:hypothetical protein